MADGLDAGLREKHALLRPYLNERQRRLIAAADAKMLGRGGIATLSRITGLSRTTCTKVYENCKGTRLLQSEYDGPGRGESERLNRLRRWSKHWSNWWILPPGAIQCRPYSGPRRAQPDWPRSCGGKDSRLAPVRLRACLEVAPGKFYSPAMGDRSVGLNIAVGDVDTPESGAGNFGNFHHEEWFSGDPKRRTDLREWGTLRIHARRKTLGRE